MLFARMVVGRIANDAHNLPCPLHCWIGDREAMANRVPMRKILIGQRLIDDHRLSRTSRVLGADCPAANQRYTQRLEITRETRD